MLILALDTAQAACSAAVYDTDKGQIVGHSRQEMPRGHAEQLYHHIDRALAQAGVTAGELGGLAVTQGPGTFTGVRVGVAAARGLALALDLPLSGVTSLEAIARDVDNFSTSRVLAAFDARRGEIYAQLFENGQALCEPQILDIPQAALLADDRPTGLVGTANTLLLPLNSQLYATEAPSLPDARNVAKIAAQRLQNPDLPQEPVQPLYLRRADAKTQKPLLASAPAEVSVVATGTEYSAVLAQIHQQGFSDSWSADSIAASLSSPGVRCWMAVTGGKPTEPAGFIISRDVAGECEILTLAVRLDMRRRKVASKLLAKVLHDAAAGPTEKVFLDVSVENTAAQALYVQAGFTEIGRRRAYYAGNDGQRHDAIIMALPV